MGEDAGVDGRGRDEGWQPKIGLPSHRGEGLGRDTFPCSRVPDKRWMGFLGWSPPDVLWHLMVGGEEAVPYGTSCVDEGVACGVAAAVVVSHGEQVGYGNGPGVGGSRSWF